ncbi:MAG: 2-C-methyl-D-erythritol 4-phosphate cytidylyltransferase [Simkania sp.]|nr:2-C-methyl-D-erythritol 4-phosphate cytidylyltransferase [Simkania sp.]
MTQTMPTIAVILLAGGTGSRMGGPIPKQFLPLKGQPIVQYSFDLFLSLPEISEIVVVCKPQFQTFFEKSPLKPIQFALPGKERQDSVASGFTHVSPSCDYVLIHDSARPLIQEEKVRQLIEEGLLIGAATLGVPMKYTVKEVDENGIVKKTLDRSRLYNIQTPQLLRRDILAKGLKKAQKQGLTLTDDVSLAELIHHPVKIVYGSDENLKITTPEDFEVAKQLVYV